jgi:aspartate kinase
VKDGPAAAAIAEEDDADETVHLLHAAFFKDPDPEIFDVGARKT